MIKKYLVYIVLFGLILQVFTFGVNADMGSDYRPVLPIDLIRNNFEWRLEGKHPITATWMDVSNWLDFELWYQEDDSVKINISFNFVIRTDYRMDIIINKRVLQYVEHHGEYNYSINYSDISVYFDFSDMVSHSDEIRHGIIEYEGQDVFWMRFIKNDVQGFYVIDPYIGFSGTSGFSTVIKNDIVGLYNLYPESSGWCDVLRAYTKASPDFGGSRLLWMALYRYDVAGYELIGEKQISIGGIGFLPTWKTFTLNNSVYIDENEIYALVIRASLNTKLYRDEIYPPGRYWIGEVEAYSNYDDPWVDSVNMGNMDWCLYAPYDLLIWDSTERMIIQFKDYNSNVIMNISDNGNVSFSGLFYENVESIPDEANIVYNINNSIWLDLNGDLYLEGTLYQGGVKQFWDGDEKVVFSIKNSTGEEIFKLSENGNLQISGLIFREI